MIKQTLALAAALALGGCAAQHPSETSGTPANPPPTVQAEAPTDAELAAYAGAHQYPTSQQAGHELRAAAIVNADAGYVKIYNFGSEPIRDADVWVNQSYVRHVNAIAPNSSVTIKTSNLYNGIGQQFSSRGEHFNLVQIHMDHALQTLMGPAPQ
jgi:hypothetical protein